MKIVIKFAKMKRFVLLSCFVLASAELPTYREVQFRSEKQELGEGYEAAGFRPTKEFFLPPQPEIVPPATSYGTPVDSYNTPLLTYTIPQLEYGVPNGEDPDITEPTVKPTTVTEVISIKPNVIETVTEINKPETVPIDIPAADKPFENQGAYYILLPNSQLQRVHFRSGNDLANQAYSARLRYRNDNAPIFVYAAAPQRQYGPPNK